MHQIAVSGALVQWQRLMLILVLLVAVWGPVRSLEVAVFHHAVAGSAGSHDAADVARDEPEGFDVFPSSGREPGGRNDHRCGHHDVERDATHAIAMRLAQPGVVAGLPVTPPGGQPRPALADLDGSRAQLRQALLVMVCVWRQ